MNIYCHNISLSHRCFWSQIFCRRFLLLWRTQFSQLLIIMALNFMFGVHDYHYYISLYLFNKQIVVLHKNTVLSFRTVITVWLWDNTIFCMGLEVEFLKQWNKSNLPSLSYYWNSDWIAHNIFLFNWKSKLEY